MPIYAYRCEACGHEHDALQKLSDPPLTDCPACGAPALKKQLTAAAFRLKGAGWYETDFKKDGKRNLHESGDAPPDAAKGKEKADAKPAETKPGGDGAATKPADAPATKAPNAAANAGSGAGSGPSTTTAPASKPAASPPPKAAAT